MRVVQLHHQFGFILEARNHFLHATKPLLQNLYCRRFAQNIFGIPNFCHATLAQFVF